MRPTIRSGHRGGDIGEKLAAFGLGIMLAGWLAFSVASGVHATCTRAAAVIASAGAPR